MAQLTDDDTIDAIDVRALRLLRLDLADARLDALLAAYGKRKRQRRAYAESLRRLLARIDEQIAAIERAAWERGT